MEELEEKVKMVEEEEKVVNGEVRLRRGMMRGSMKRWRNSKGA